MSSPVIIRSFEQYKQTIKKADEEVVDIEEIKEELLEELPDIPLSSISPSQVMSSDSGLGIGVFFSILAVVLLFFILAPKLLPKAFSNRRLKIK